MKNKSWTVSHPEWGTWEMEWSDDTNFEELKKVIGAQGFIFDDSKKFCVIKLSCKEKWLITCGKPEKEDNNYEETLIREVDEEGLKLERDLKYPSSFFIAEQVSWDRVKQIFYIGDKHLEMTLKIVPQKIN